MSSQPRVESVNAIVRPAEAGDACVIARLHADSLKQEDLLHTGAHKLNDAEVALNASFGIGTPVQARAAAAHVDGVVVGSRAVQVAEDGPDAIREYVASLRAVFDSPCISDAA